MELKLADLGYRYSRGSFDLSGINATLGPGTWFLTGPNGSGKSTLLNLVAGNHAPDLGSIELDDSPQSPAQLRGRVGLMTSAGPALAYLTVSEHLALFSHLWGSAAVPPRHFPVTDDLLAIRAGALSLGQRQRLAYQLAAFNDPGVLLLDEPFNGLDAQSSAALCAELADRAERGRITVVASHLLDHLDRLGAGRIDLAEGRLV